MSPASPVDDAAVGRRRPPATVKILVAGGFGVGKTTFIGARSDIEPLSTEAAITRRGAGLDGAGERPGKTSTTVALDFGRVELPGPIWLYLFGTPGQERFLFLWDDLAVGALGAVLLVDTTRLTDCFAALDELERSHLPFVVAVNCFEGVAHHGLDQVRDALGLADDVPVLYTDVRRREAARDVTVALVRHALSAAADGVGRRRSATRAVAVSP